MGQMCDIVITIQSPAETIIDTSYLVVGKRICVALAFTCEFNRLQKSGAFWPYIFFMRSLDVVWQYAEYEISIDPKADEIL